MKILLIGEFSNVHHTLAQGLRALGHRVTVVSNGDFWKDYPRDIDISRREGRLGGVLLTLRLLTLLPRLRGYDVVQIISPMFVELKAERNFWLYKYLRRANRTVFMGVNGNDHYVIDACTRLKVLRYSDFNIGQTDRDSEDIRAWKQLWMGGVRREMNRYMAETADGIVAGLYEYQACYEPFFPEKTRFIPYPIVLPKCPEGLKEPDAQGHPAVEDHRETTAPVRFFIGISRNRSVYKGTDIMLRALEDVCRQYPQAAEMRKAEGVPFAQYQQLMDSSDVLLDQLYSYTPSMNSLLAMSKGIVVVGGGEPENYEILGETELRPIVNVEPTYDSVRHELEQLVLHPERLPELKRQSVEYVKRHHDFLKVARQYVEFYQQALGSL